tara:strand:+ start:142 stop:585 length:444 start_codon:yes stop_codon:yes gene_type:complete
LKHELFFDGNLKEYSWTIKTGKEIKNQIREHPPAYLSGGKLDIKSKEESRFIALHVGIYWGLGVFIIKDFDMIHVMCDSKEMYEILIRQHKTKNQIIDDKIHFINQLVDHRNLKLEYNLIEPTKNIATKYLSGKDKTSASRDSRGFV